MLHSVFFKSTMSSGYPAVCIMLRSHINKFIKNKLLCSLKQCFTIVVVILKRVNGITQFLQIPVIQWGKSSLRVCWPCCWEFWVVKMRQIIVKSKKLNRCSISFRLQSGCYMLLWIPPKCGWFWVERHNGDKRSVALSVSRIPRDSRFLVVYRTSC